MHGPQTVLRRRGLIAAGLAAPTFALPRPGRAGPWLRIPPFPEWIGRTALLRGDGGAARLLLAGDGTGTMSVKLFLVCRVLPVTAWQLAPGGLSVRYSRVSALDAARRIAGEARILPEEGQVVWTEAAAHTAEFEAFAEPAAGRCT